MNEHVARPLTVDDYLNWSEKRPDEGRCELINGVVVPMSPERSQHWQLKGRIFLALTQAIQSAGIVAVATPEGPTVRIDAHTAYEPDALVYLGPPVARDVLEISAPIVVVEVSSPNTRHLDLSAKLIGYFKVASVRHYLVIDPDEAVLGHYVRSADSGAGYAFLGGMRSGQLRLDPPGLDVDVGALFGAT